MVLIWSILLYGSLSAFSIPCGWNKADLDCDGRVGLSDFSLFAENWLEEYVMSYPDTVQVLGLTGDFLSLNGIYPQDGTLNDKVKYDYYVLDVLVGRVGWSSGLGRWVLTNAAGNAAWANEDGLDDPTGVYTGSVGAAVGTVAFVQACTAVYPQEDEVKEGVVYGPSGTDYTGTLETTIEVSLDSSDIQLIADGVYDRLEDVLATLSVELSSSDLQTIANSVSDTILQAPELTKLTPGTGTEVFTYTVLDDDDNPIPNVQVYAYNSSALAYNNLIATATSNNFGVATLYLDPGTYYLVRVKAGYSFTNPDTEVVEAS